VLALQFLFCRKDGAKPHKAVKREIEIDRQVPKITEVLVPNDLEDMNLQGKFRTAWTHGCVEGFNACSRKDREFICSLFAGFVFSYLWRWCGSPIIALRSSLPR
jgi:hypothetical protein